MTRLTCLLLLLSCVVHAQLGLRAAFPEVTGLDLAWAGGLNAPQPQAADLDGDGTRDLYIFERAGDRQTALRVTANGDYEEAPELTRHFPKDLTDWVILRDYNRDGVMDIFAYSPLVDGIRVYDGNRRADGLLEFSQTPIDFRVPVLFFTLDNGAKSNIFVSAIDYPDINDVDNDGDLDILTFNVAGGYVNFFENTATDGLEFILSDDCWGGFFESGISTALDLAPSPGECVSNLRGPTDTPVQLRHAGSTVLTLDYDGNGLRDILLGDISFRNLILGLNFGSEDTAWIGDQDPTWPSDGLTAEITTFPAAFTLDFDRDGDDDILAAPSVRMNGADISSLWYYENTGDNDYRFRDSQLLVRQMIDVGTAANPVAFDYDGDGDRDLIVANEQEFNNANLAKSRLRVFRNVSEPGGVTRFEPAEEDFLGLLALSGTTSFDWSPAFGDMDGDGDEDAVVGERRGTLLYFENTAGVGNPPAFARPVFDWFDIDARSLVKPSIIDLDRDGLQDLAIGSDDGRIRFYRNIGTVTDPRFSPDLAAEGNVLQLGGINTQPSGAFSGNARPVFLQNAAQTLVITGNLAGQIEYYRLNAEVDYRDASKFELITKAVDDVDVGARSAPCITDFNGDNKLEMVVGNQAGGLNYFTTDLVRDEVTSVGEESAEPVLDLRIYPNPVRDAFRIMFSGARSREQALTIHDALGRLVLSVADYRPGQTVDVSDLGRGVYFVSVGRRTERVVRE